MGSQHFRVIQGAWQSSPAWLDFPRTLTARSPFDREKFVEFRVSRDVMRGAEMRRRQPAFDLWSMLAGQVPPLPGAEKMVEYGDQDLSRLIDAHACFKGLKRPCGSDDNGDDFFAYVLKPKAMFTFDARPPVCRVRKESVPNDVVLMACVRLDEPCDAALNMGVLAQWQLVEADERDPHLPLDFENRFVKRLW